MPSYVAFFDLDKTLIRTNSGVTMIREALREGMLPWGKLAGGLYLALLNRFGLKEQFYVVDELAKWLKGKSYQSIQALSGTIFSKSLVHALRPEMEAEIRLHKDRGAAVVILSSALAPVCSAVASHLRLDGVICSEFEIKEGLFTGRPVGKICYAAEKLRRMEAYCTAFQYKLPDAYYYADAISDYDALQATGHPVCVHPDRALRKIAKKNGWEIRDC